MGHWTHLLNPCGGGRATDRAHVAAPPIGGRQWQFEAAPQHKNPRHAPADSVLVRGWANASMKLYTRKGDDGGTVLLDGTRVRKDDGRIAVFGTLDELNAHIGVAAGLAAGCEQDSPIATIHQRLSHIQSELFSIGAELAAIGSAKTPDSIVQTTPQQVARLETWIDEACEPLAPLKTFVLPGGTPLASQLHVCRTVCRRAERGVVSLSPQHDVNSNTLVFLNRLSDLLFAWGRLANHASGVADVPWRKPE